jgi:hypothetical protein
MVLASIRHSRAGGIQVWSPTQLAWIPAFAGMTEHGRRLRSADHPCIRIFEGGHEEDEGRENLLETRWLCQSGSPFSVSFMIFVVSDGVQVMVQAVAIET